MSTEAVVAIAAILLTPGGIAFLYLRKTLRLSDDAAAAVAPDAETKPANVDEAFIALAQRVDSLAEELTKHRIYLPQVISWGHRGWAHAPVEQREPLPKPPEFL